MRSPLISCLMVTAGGTRLPRMVHSIADYCRQTYPRRELVVVADQMPAKAFSAIRDHCRSLDRSDIHVVRTNEPHTLGALRNLAVDTARGEVVCQWDDDDIYHPRRLECQWVALRKRAAGAIYLKGVMHFFEPYRMMYWLDVEHSATLMAFKNHMSRFPDVGEIARSSEAKAMLDDFGDAKRKAHLRDMPYLYTYVFHGTNTIAAAAHLALAQHSAANRDIARHKKRLLAELGQLSFDRRGVQLMSSTGAVTVLD